jgi:hypothetical protein
MLHAYAITFKVMGNVKNFAKTPWELNKAFSWQNFLGSGTIALSFVFDKYCSIMK